MGDGFRGVSAERDGRFKLAEKKLMAKMKFPPEFVHKVDMSKVHLEVLRPWVAKKVSVLPRVHRSIARTKFANSY
jgi:serine/arginine repetitive matrix protein 1